MRTAGLASRAAECLMPRKRPLPAAIWASSTGLRAIAKKKIDMADDAGAGSRRTIETACAHGGAAIDKFGLADRSVRDRTVCAIHRRGLHKHCRFHIVAGVHVGEEFGQKVVIEGPVHEMMMGVDDRQIGVDDLFAQGCEPWLVDRPMDGRSGSSDRTAHRRAPQSQRAFEPSDRSDASGLAPSMAPHRLARLRSMSARVRLAPRPESTRDCRWAWR